jgi:hypothetical protein
MKKIIGCLAVLIFMVPVAFAAVVENWGSVSAGKDTGTFTDTMGSKIDFVVGPGPDGSSKALKITSTMIQGGYCGIWHNFSADLSKNDSIKFKAKTNSPGEIEMAFKDTYNVQYIARFSVSSKDWTEITVPFSAFNKDPYYTPPEAVLGHPMDLSKATGMNFAPKIIGDSIVEIGPVEGAGGASGSAAPAAAAPAAQAAAPAAAPPALPSEVSLPTVPDVMELPPALTSAQPSAAPAVAAPAPAVAAPAAPAPAASVSSASSGAVVENWGSVSAGKDTGTFVDTMGSKIDFVVGPGPDGSSKALKITSTMIQGGYCGIWHNFSADLSKSNSVKFKAKTNAPGDVEMAFKDTYNVQYIARFSVSSKDWTEITVPFSAFNKDPYYTPPEAVLGHPMDLSKATGMNFAPKIIGDSIVEIGPVSGAGTASAGTAPAPAAQAVAAAPAAAVPATKPAASSGTAVPILIYDQLDAKAAGGFQDTTGSAFKFEVKDNPNKAGGKYMIINYTLVKGGWSGMWCRAGGIEWDGANLSGAKDVVIKVFSKKPIVIGLALKDKNKNQYVAETPLLKGGKWEAVSVPLSAFILDPYYTPPDATKGAPKDFSSVGTFNIQPKSEGTYTFAVDTFVAK